MLTVINAIRSTLFNVYFYSFTLIFCTLYILPAGVLFGRSGVLHGLGIYCTTNKTMARWLMGIDAEFRGTEKLPKEGGLILAAAHQSTFDPILTFLVRPDLTAIAKKELSRVPAVGQVLKIMGIIFVDRAKGNANKQMDQVGKQIREDGVMLIVYPQATRVTPGNRKKLKSGAYHLAKDTGLPVYTVATDTGLYWTNGFFHRSGTATFEIVRELDPDMGKDAFMRELEQDVVLRSEALALEKQKEHLLKLPEKAQAGAFLPSD